MTFVSRTNTPSADRKLVCPGSQRTSEHVASIASLALLFMAGCATNRTILASGTLAGQDISVPVKGELERYYIEDYFSYADDACPLKQAINEAIASAHADPYDAASLQKLASETSIDLATLYFVSEMYAEPKNRRMQDRFEARVQLLLQPGSISSKVSVDRSYTIAFVPGYGYKMDQSTGSDFARQRALLREWGFDVRLIETDEVGTVEANALRISDALKQMDSGPNGVVVVSTSKGGPEVALALGHPESHEGLSHVRAWISVGGILRGSPYADYLQDHPFRWFLTTIGALLGHPHGIIENLSTEVRAPVMDGLVLPPELLVVHYVGAPLESQVPRASRGRFKALKHLGPNDGLTLLADELVPGGIVITDIGLDHYFRHPQIDLITLTLTQIVLEELELLGRIDSCCSRPARKPGMAGESSLD